MLGTLHICALVAVLGAALRIWQILPHANSSPARKRTPGERCSLGVFLGSGGHTAEIQTLLSAIPLDRYSPRVYFYCPPDEISLRVIQRTEDSSTGGSSKYSVIALPRARRVGESPLSTLFSAAKTLLAALYVIFWRPLLMDWKKPLVDVLLINGPGTCVVLVVACYIRRFLGIPFTRIIYVESFARVNTLSLSGRILRPLVDTFVVQWPEASKAYDQPGRRKATYRGWLV